MIIASPLAGIAADELIDPTPAVAEIFDRYIGSPEFSNLPRKFKTAITGHPSLDVAPEVNDIAFVPTVHPDHGAGFDVWVGGGLSTNPMLAQSPRRLGPARRRPRRLVGRRQPVPRLRLPPATRPRPAEVPGRRLGGRAVPRGAARRVPPPRLLRRRAAPEAARQRRPRRRARAGRRPLLRRRRTDGRPGLRHHARASWPTSSRRTAPPGSARRRTRSSSSSTSRPTTSSRWSPTSRTSASRRRPSQWRRSTMACTGIEFCKLAIVDTKDRAARPRRRPRAADPRARHPDHDPPQRMPQLLRPDPGRRHRPEGAARPGRRRRLRRGVPGPPRRRARARGRASVASCAPTRSRRPT